MTILIWSLKHLFMVLYVTAIPESAFSALWQAAEAVTEEDVPDLADNLIMMNICYQLKIFAVLTIFRQ